MMSGPLGIQIFPKPFKNRNFEAFKFKTILYIDELSIASTVI